MNSVKLLAEAIISPEALPKADGADIPAILAVVLTIFGAVAVIVAIYAGIQMIISQGNAEKVAQARRGIIYAIVGLIIILLAQALVAYVSGELSK